MPKTLFDKLWESHLISSLPSGDDLIAIDRIFLHERTGSIALSSLVDAGREVRDPKQIFVTMDHIVSTEQGRGVNSARSPGGEIFIKATRQIAHDMELNLIDILDRDQGIVHVISPELGIAQPGLTLICPDSHTCSQGALGALAWGIGSTDAEHAMVTGALRVKKPPQMRITVTGKLREGVTAKDLALYIIQKLGASGAQHCAVEYAGPVIEEFSIEERLTLCNMAVEFAAFTALIAPDKKTQAYLTGRKYAPKELDRQAALKVWSALYSDADAIFDYQYIIDAEQVPPIVTWGISPDQAAAITDNVPKNANPKALDYMGLKAGHAINRLPIGGAFIGSCTNARLSDLRLAAKILKERVIAPDIKAICVPGSMAVLRAAEAEGLDKIFKEAGFIWGQAGCGFCFYAGGETFAPETRVISSTNRNFEGRQGPKVRTHLASPAIVAASAVLGRIGSPDELEAL